MKKWSEFINACFLIYKYGSIEEMKKNLTEICRGYYPQSVLKLVNSTIAYFESLRKSDEYLQCLYEIARELRQDKFGI